MLILLNTTKKTKCFELGLICTKTKLDKNVKLWFYEFYLQGLFAELCLCPKH